MAVPLSTVGWGSLIEFFPFLVGGLLYFMDLSGCRRVPVDAALGLFHFFSEWHGHPSLASLLVLVQHLQSLGLSSDDLMDFLLIQLIWSSSHQ